MNDINKTLGTLRKSLKRLEEQPEVNSSHLHTDLSTVSTLLFGARDALDNSPDKESVFLKFDEQVYALSEKTIVNIGGAEIKIESITNGEDEDLLRVNLSSAKFTLRIKYGESFTKVSEVELNKSVDIEVRSSISKLVCDIVDIKFPITLHDIIDRSESLKKSMGGVKRNAGDEISTKESEYFVAEENISESGSVCEAVESSQDNIIRKIEALEEVDSEVLLETSDLINATFISPWGRWLLNWVLGSQPVTLRIESSLNEDGGVDLEKAKITLAESTFSLRKHLIRRLACKAIKERRIGIVIDSERQLKTLKYL